MDNKQPILGQTPAEPPKDDPRVVIAQIAYVNHVQFCAGERKTRLEDLMQRKSAKKWDAAKKAKMVRRLMTANSELEQCTLALAELGPRFEALKAQATTNPNAPQYVDAPATPPTDTSTTESPFGG